MSNELDPELRRLFAEREERLDHGPFLVRIATEIDRARRVRLMRQLAALAVVLVVVAAAFPWLAPVSAAVMEQAGRLSLAAGSFLVTPVGWVVSMILAAYILMRVRYSRR
jgi:hypothetical protein